jgi:hypothetical protein
MMRLYIEGRQVDLTAAEPLLITREIADIREPEKRSSDWSKTFRIPGTSNNNRIFGHIFDIAQEQLNTGTQFAPDFNPNKKAAALITVDEVEQVRGFVRLLNIAIVRGGEIEYEVSVHGVAADFFAKIRNKRLSEIDLSDLNHTLSRTAIKDSWSHDWADGYVYPMIDRGRQERPYSIWAVDDFLPCVFAKRIVDEIFEDAGYSYTSDSFFNSDEFKSRVIPFPGYAQLSEDQVNARYAQATRSTDATYTAGQTIVFNNEVSDVGGNYNPATGKYTSPAGGAKYGISVGIKINVSGLSDVTYPYLSAAFACYVGGRFVERFTVGIMVNQAVVGASREAPYDVFDVYAGDGEEIEIRLENVYDASLTSRATTILSGFTLTIQSGSSLTIRALQQSYGKDQTVNFNSFFSAGPWQQDKFLQDLIRFDNLYIEATDRTNVLHIAPRDEFYRDTVVHDITGIIDRSQPFEITPMGELDGNPYVFTYTQGKDIDSEDYFKAIGTVYGEARILVDNEFIQQEKKIETSFASTPYIHAGGEFRIASMTTADKAAAELRLLYWSGKITTATWLLCDQFTYLNNVNCEVIENGYPHAGHLDNPFTPTKDLCFGMPAYINLPAGINYTNNNLYNRNWRKYINEITDRNSKLVRVRVYITPAEWQRWLFRDLYFFDGQYFRLNKITDYPVGGSDLVVCEFLKLKTSSVFTPQTGTAGGGFDIKDDNNDRFPDLRGGFDRPVRRFGWASNDGSNARNLKTFVDLTRGLTDMNYADIGNPSTGDKFRPAIEWSGADWNIVLIQEP